MPGNDEASFTVRIMLINHDRFPISPVHGIEAQEIDEVLGVYQIIDRDHFELWPGDSQLYKRAPDAAESIHGDSGHTHLLTVDDTTTMNLCFQREFRLQSARLRPTVAPACNAQCSGGRVRYNGLHFLQQTGLHIENESSNRDVFCDPGM